MALEPRIELAGEGLGRLEAAVGVASVARATIASSAWSPRRMRGMVTRPPA